MAHAGFTHPHWRFVLTSLGGEELGEVLECSERQVVRALSMPSTAMFKVPVTTPLLSDILQRDLLLKCYRSDTLMFHGPIVTTELAVEDDVSTPTVACGAIDPSWRFEKRVAGKSATGTVFVTTDRLTIAESLIGTANSDNPTGVQTLGQTCGSTATFIAGPYRKLSECIAEMANTLDGFDWRIDPIEYSSTGPYIGRFKASADLGSTKAQAVFEYQGRSNMRQPNFQRSLVDIANFVYSVPDDGAASPLGVRSASNSTSITARGRYEEVVDTSGLTNSTLRDSVLNDHLLFRKNPRQVLSFSPDYDDYSGRVPEYGADYQIGDYVRGVVRYNGVLLIDGFVRLYKMQFDIDGNMLETLTPTVVQEATS